MKNLIKTIAATVAVPILTLTCLEASAGCTNVAHVKNNTPAVIIMTVHSSTKVMKPLEMSNFQTPCFANYKVHAKLENGVYIHKKTHFKSWPSDNDIIVSYQGTAINGGEIDLSSVLAAGKFATSVL